MRSDNHDHHHAIAASASSPSRIPTHKHAHATNCWACRFGQAQSCSNLTNWDLRQATTSTSLSIWIGFLSVHKPRPQFSIEHTLRHCLSTNKRKPMQPMGTFSARLVDTTKIYADRATSFEGKPSTRAKALTLRSAASYTNQLTAADASELQDGSNVWTQPSNGNRAEDLPWL